MIEFKNAKSVSLKNIYVTSNTRYENTIYIVNTTNVEIDGLSAYLLSSGKFPRKF